MNLTLSLPELSSFRIMPKKINATTGARRHFYWLDWLRFIAALMVVACHARGGNWVEWGRLDHACQTKAAYAFFLSTRAGFEWVIVFFVLSGFLVGGKVLERAGSRTFDPMAYGLDRVSRIWMPLIPALLLTAAIGGYLGHSISAWGFWGNLLGLQGVLCSSFGRNYPLWSLAYEIWFYLLAGCSAVAINNDAKNRLAAYLGVLICVMVFTKLDASFLFCWVLGAISYSQIGVINGKAAVAGCLLTAAGYASSQLTSESVSLEKYAFLQFLPSHAVAALILSAGLALVIPVLSQLQPASKAMAVFERWGSPLAAFSYTLYLTHYPLLDLLGRLFPERHAAMSIASMLWFVGKIGFCLFVAWVLYLPFERNTSVVRGWLRKRLGEKCRNSRLPVGQIQP